MCMLRWKNIDIICDRTCENQTCICIKLPKFFSNLSDHNLCSIYTNNTPLMQNLMEIHLKVTEWKYSL